MRGGRKNASFGRKLVLNLCNLGHVELSIIVIISLDSVYHHFLKTHTSIIRARCSQDFCLKTITNDENVCARGAVGVLAKLATLETPLMVER